MSERPTTAPREGATGLLTGLSSKLVELDAAVSRQAERFKAVLEIGTALASARDVDAVLVLVMERLAALVEAEAASLFVHEPAEDVLVSRVLRGGGSGLTELRLPAGRGVVGHVLRTGETLLIPDAYADARFNPAVDKSSGFTTRSIIAAPLRHVSGRILGVVEVMNRVQGGPFSDEDRALVEAIAAQVAGVLDNVLLMDATRAQNEQLRSAMDELSVALRDLDLLYELEQAIYSTGDQAELLDTVLQKATSLIGAASGAVLLLEEEQGVLRYRGARGPWAEARRGLALELGQDVAGHVAAAGACVRLARAEDCPQHDGALARRLGEPASRAVLCVPIKGDDRVLGALELGDKPGGFDAADERFATLLAGQTGRAVLLRRAREEGERKARLASLGQMLSGVLHDLRTPMTIISGYAQMMAMEDAPEERRKFAGIIEKQFEHIGAMTKETLAFARGERDLLLRKVYLQDFFAEVAEYLRRDLGRAGVELVLEVAYTGVLRADENKLKRVVYNIARNAAEAMPGGGRFTLGAARDGAHLVLTFKDTGAGIPAEIADRLFESFVTAGKREGSGLGLAIVKRIVDAHGGAVRFESAPGAGTTFEVRLPLAGA
jgi:signal transduction histidine kinase